MHEDGDTDSLCGFLRRGTGACSRLGVRRDAPIATLHHPDRHRHQFFDLAAKRSVSKGGAAQGANPL